VSVCARGYIIMCVRSSSSSSGGVRARACVRVYICPVLVGGAVERKRRVCFVFVIRRRPRDRICVRDEGKNIIIIMYEEYKK